MKKLTLVAAVAAIGLSSPAFAFDGSITADVQFDWATNGTAIGWTASAANALNTVNNNTYFTSLAGFNSTTYYNPDFAKASDATGWCATPFEAFQAQYACKTTPVGTDRSPIADEGPGAAATGTLTITATTLTGTLTVINTNDEGAGPQPGTIAATGYNVRSADGSPFKNVWYGVSNQATLTVNLTGAFTNTPGAWSISGGTVAFADPALQCAVADFSGVLCATSATAGGFRPNGSFLSWGIDLQGGGVQEISIFNAPGDTKVGTIGGVLASLGVDSAGNITTNQGEFRNGSSQSACNTQLRYDGAGISCGTMQVGFLSITGTAAVIPVPAAAWLFGSALGLLGLARRKLAA